MKSSVLLDTKLYVNVFQKTFKIRKKADLYIEFSCIEPCVT